MMTMMKIVMMSLMSQIEMISLKKLTVRTIK